MEKDIFTIIATAKEVFKDLGLSADTIRTYQERSFNQVIRSYEVSGIQQFQPELMNKLLIEAENQFNNGIISRKSRNWRIRGIRILNEIYETGTFQWKIYQKNLTTEFPDPYIMLGNSFVESLTVNHSSIRSIKSITVRFFWFIKDRNIKNINDISPDDLRSFLSLMHDTRAGSMDEVVSTMKKLFQYLSRNGYKPGNYWQLLSSSRSRDHKVKPAMMKEEIVLIIGQIDRETAPGKRDFAILSLAITTGLRAGDIASLALTDFHWKAMEIHLAQGKTGKRIVLPMQPTVRDAIADYILNERPKSASKTVFLRSSAPYDALKNGVSIACIFRRYLKKAGIEHAVNDGKTFHGIRRSVGTSMVSNGVPVTTVSQVLGHQSIRATRQYVSLDLQGLRKCALPMSSLGGVHELF